MKHENVSIQIEQSFNLNNYQSIKISAMLHARLEDGEDPEAAGELLAIQAKTIIYKAAKEATDAHGVAVPSIRKFYMGQEVDQFPEEDF